MATHTSAVTVTINGPEPSVTYTQPAAEIPYGPYDADEQITLDSGAVRNTGNVAIRVSFTPPNGHGALKEVGMLEGIAQNGVHSPGVHEVVLDLDESVNYWSKGRAIDVPVEEATVLNSTLEVSVERA